MAKTSISPKSPHDISDFNDDVMKMTFHKKKTNES